MSVKSVRCSYCGVEYKAMAVRPGVNRCPACRHAYKVAHCFYHNKLIRYKVGTLEDVHAKVVEAMERFAARRKAGEAVDVRDCIGEYSKPKPQRKELKGHCPYCGRPTKDDSTYCPRCVFEGLNLLHVATGRTNGWDKAEKSPVTIQGGWRGRAVMGGKTLRQRRDCL